MMEEDESFTRAYLLFTPDGSVAPSVDWLPEDLERLPTHALGTVEHATHSVPSTGLSLDWDLSKAPPLLSEHQLRYGEFVHNRLVNYVRMVAGVLGLRAKDLLDTGFEEVGPILRSLGRQPYEPSRVVNNNGPAAAAVAAPPPDLGATPKIEGYGREALERFFEFAVELRKLDGSLADVQDFIRRTEHRDTRAHEAAMQWLTLPFNMSKFYFSESLHSATALALVAVKPRSFRSLQDFFNYVLDSNLLPAFATFVGRLIQQNRAYSNRVGGTRYQMNGMQTQINVLGRQLRKALELEFGSPQQA